jgi:hypothetical protein
MTNYSDLAAEADMIADEEAGYEAHEIFADDPTD